MKTETLIAQISDMHIVESDIKNMSNNLQLEKAIQKINDFNPKVDVIIATGDLTDNGSIKEYINLQKILSKSTPKIYLIPGNHDKRKNLKEIFSDHTYLRNDKFFCYSIENLPIALIGLDTLIEGKPGGEICNERISWLKKRLDKLADKPVIIFLHHPPFDTGIWWMDAIGLQGRNKLKVLIEKYNNIEAIISGHIHRQVQRRWAGTLGYIAPSTAHQIELDLEGKKFLQVNNEPAAFSLHHWKCKTGLISHICYIDQAESSINPNIEDIDKIREYFEKAKSDFEKVEK